MICVLSNTAIHAHVLLLVLYLDFKHFGQGRLSYPVFAEHTANGVLVSWML